MAASHGHAGPSVRRAAVRCLLAGGVCLIGLSPLIAQETGSEDGPASAYVRSVGTATAHGAEAAPVSLSAIPARSTPSLEISALPSGGEADPEWRSDRDHGVERLLSALPGGSALASSVGGLRELISEVRGVLRFRAFGGEEDHRLRIRLETPPRPGVRVSFHL